MVAAGRCWQRSRQRPDSEAVLEHFRALGTSSAKESSATGKKTGNREERGKKPGREEQQQNNRRGGGGRGGRRPKTTQNTERREGRKPTGWERGGDANPGGGEGWDRSAEPSPTPYSSRRSVRTAKVPTAARRQEIRARRAARRSARLTSGGSPWDHDRDQRAARAGGARTAFVTNGAFRAPAVPPAQTRAHLYRPEPASAAARRARALRRREAVPRRRGARRSTSTRCPRSRPRRSPSACSSRFVTRSRAHGRGEFRAASAAHGRPAEILPSSASTSAHRRP